MLPTMSDSSLLFAWGPGSRRARWTIFAVAAVLALVTLATAGSSWRSSVALSETVLEGQAATIRHLFEREITPGMGPPSSSDLDQFVRDNEELGVRWVAILAPGGQIVAQGGEGSVSVRDALPRRPEDLMRLGEVVRVRIPPPAGPVGPAPLRPPGERFPGERFPGKAPPGQAPPGQAPPGLPLPGEARDLGIPPGVVIDFAPSLAGDLEARAWRDLAIGGLGATALLLIAGLVSMLSLRAEQAEERLLEQRNLAALGEMSAVLAHELKNPLASLKGHAQLLEEALPEDGRQRAKANKIVGEAKRLQELIESLLAFVRSGKIQPRNVDPTAIAQRVASIDADRVIVEAAEAPKTWSLDPDRFEQVLINLVSNALEASAAEHTVSVTIRSANDELVVEVRDHGSGVDPKVRAHMFEPFRTTKTRGAGLGLAICRHIVEAHGGTIDATDATGGGTVFTAVIPSQSEA
jgi:two-component system sensor histidine kinase HydH